MILRKKLMQKLYHLYPRFLAKKNHDYVGLMLAPKKEEINNIVVCLDLDKKVLEQIDLDKVDLIITHHPFYYGKSKVNIIKNDPLKKELTSILKEKGIGVASFHTNFDEGKNGMNDILASKLELIDIYAPASLQMMRIGSLNNPLSIDEFVYYVKKHLNVSYALLINEGSRLIQKVGIVGGGGSYLFKYAKDENCDIYISGDASHHVRRDIVNNHFNYLDIPHEVERVFIPSMKKILLQIDASLNVIEIDHEEEVKVY